MRDRSSQLEAVKCVVILTFILLFAGSAFGQLTVTPSTINFGNVPLGSGVSQSVAIANSSGQSLILSQASITGTGFSLSGLALPVTLSPGQSRSVTVSFQPSVRRYCGWQHFLDVWQCIARPLQENSQYSSADDGSLIRHGHGRRTSCRQSRQREFR